MNTTDTLPTWGEYGHALVSVLTDAATYVLTDPTPMGDLVRAACILVLCLVGVAIVRPLLSAADDSDPFALED